eukprot:3324734-Amphidinium_carterae.1
MPESTAPDEIGAGLNCGASTLAAALLCACVSFTWAVATARLDHQNVATNGGEPPHSSHLHHFIHTVETKSLQALFQLF